MTWPAVKEGMVRLICLLCSGHGQLAYYDDPVRQCEACAGVGYHDVPKVIRRVRGRK